MAGYDAALINLVDARIRQAAAKDRSVGTLIEVVGSYAYVAMDGSSIALPCKYLRGLTLEAGGRVTMDKYGSDWVVSGSFTPPPTPPPPVRRGIRLRRAASQSVPTATATTIDWDTEDEDDIDGTGAWWPGSGDTITVPEDMDGLVTITYNVVVASLFTVGRCFGSINITSTVTGIPTIFRHPFDASEDRVTVNPVIPLAAGDSFTCDVFHSEGSNRNVTAWVCAYRIGA